MVIRGTFEMLSWSNQKGWSRKASNTQKRASHDNSMVFTLIVLSCKHWSKEEASQPHYDSALDLKWFSIHMGDEWTISMMIGLHQAINWTSHCYCGA